MIKLTRLALLLLINLSAAIGQTPYFIRGVITDASTGEPVPFANVGIIGTRWATTSDFEGRYVLQFQSPADSLTVSYVGYVRRTKRIVRDTVQQTIDFQLQPDTYNLKEVIVRSGENPAWRILRRIVENRKQNDQSGLSAYEYESYNKIQIDVDNINEKFRNRKSVKKMTGIVEKYDEIKGEDGSTIIPIFISESVSSVYFRQPPKKKKEVIHKTKISGIGVSDGSLVSQLAGSSFQQYNFYLNWLNILQKDFVSPVSEHWNLYYNYFLADSASNGSNYDYQIEFEPKKEQDLAFRGSFWVDGENFALTQIDAAISRSANINYVENLRIQQSYELQNSDSTYMPVKTRVIIDAENITKNSVGMLIKFYSINRKFLFNKPHPTKFYDAALELDEDYREHDSSFWLQHRPETLTPAEKLSFTVIDSLKTLPAIRTYTELFNFLVNGYQKVNEWNIDIGPNLYTYAFNNIEGHRFRLGFRTDTEFSKKWVVKAHLVYGTRDQAFKYGGTVEHIFTRKPWTLAGISYNKDIEQLGLTRDNIGASSFFGAFTRFGSLQKPFYLNDLSLYFRREVVRGLTHQISLRHRDFNPIFDFAYRTNPAAGEASPLNSRFTTTEFDFETRLAHKETFLQNENERISLGNVNSPIVTIRYILGVKNFMNSDFGYHKLTLNVKQNFRLGIAGRTYYNLALGYIPSTVPYPLLYNPLGNQSVFFVDNAFNLMKYFEFVSDHYVTLRVEHDDNGLIFNRIPAIRKLKWRLLATGRLYYGRLSTSNLNLTPSKDLSGNPLETISGLGNTPYIELGYGINNILRVIRVDGVHRITYRNTPGATKFGVKISFWFNI